VDNTAVLDRARIGDADGAADGGDAGSEQERPCEPEECVRLDERVGVDGEDVWMVRGVQRRVERVSFAAVLLVDDEELRVQARAIVSPNAPCLHGDHERRGDLEELVRLDEPRHRAVGGAVVHDDDLVARILEGQERAGAIDDRELLVVRGDEDAEPRERVRPEYARERLVVGEVPMRPELRDREDQQQPVERVER
jgi:hypothetical protein